MRAIFFLRNKKNEIKKRRRREDDTRSPSTKCQKTHNIIAKQKTTFTLLHNTQQQRWALFLYSRIYHVSLFLHRLHTHTHAAEAPYHLFFFCEQQEKRVIFQTGRRVWRLFTMHPGPFWKRERKKEYRSSRLRRPWWWEVRRGRPAPPTQNNKKKNRTATAACCIDIKWNSTTSERHDAFIVESLFFTSSSSSLPRCYCYWNHDDVKRRRRRRRRRTDRIYTKFLTLCYVYFFSIFKTLKNS